jgi:hypothetical protein
VNTSVLLASSLGLFAVAMAYRVGHWRGSRAVETWKRVAAAMVGRAGG